MKKLVFAVILASLTACGAEENHSAPASSQYEPASDNILAGKIFSRKVTTSGSFGQPSSVREHVIKFSPDGVHVTDNANTFFGNPPSTGTYRLKSNVIRITAEQGFVSTYFLTKDGKTIHNGEGQTLTLRTGV